MSGGRFLGAQGEGGSVQRGIKGCVGCRCAIMCRFVIMVILVEACFEDGVGEDEERSEGLGWQGGQLVGRAVLEGLEAGEFCECRVDVGTRGREEAPAALGEGGECGVVASSLESLSYAEAGGSGVGANDATFGRGFEDGGAAATRMAPEARSHLMSLLRLGP